MASPRSNEASPNDPYNRLIRKALRLVKRSNREDILAVHLARALAERDRLQRQVRQADSEEDAPVEVARALRSRSKTDQVVAVGYDGMVIRAVLHPIGRRNPARERAVWRCMRETAKRVRRQRSDE